MDLAFLLPAAALAVGLVGAWLVTAARAGVWRRVAQRAGLSDVQEATTLGVLTRLRGKADGLSVQIAAYHRGKHDHGTRVLVEGAGQIAPSLDLRAEGLASALDRTFGGKELEVGDPDFDAAVYAQGPEELLLPLLSADARTSIRALVALGARVVDGTVRADVRAINTEKIYSALAAALRAARAMRTPADLVQRLAETARTDDLPAVRARCLDLLARRHAEHPLAREAFREALGSHDAHARLIAAMALGPEGRATLLALACDTGVEDALSARAIAALGADLPLERAVAVLDRTSPSGRRASALAAVASIAAHGTAAAATHLGPLLTGSDQELAISAARSLGAITDPAVEPPLVAALSSEHADVRAAAAEALARSGTVAAVAALHAAADAHLLDLGLRSAARQAIAAIQERVPGASPGQMTLADHESGRVSLANEAAGSVSLARDDKATQ